MRSSTKTAPKRNVVTPYQRLAREYDHFRTKVALPRSVLMWFYPKERLSEGWALADLYERTKAAEQLGYDVVLYARDDGLNVRYVQKRPA